MHARESSSLVLFQLTAENGAISQASFCEYTYIYILQIDLKMPFKIAKGAAMFFGKAINPQGFRKMEKTQS